MFGEELMVDIEPLTIDDRTRIVLPKFTKAEVGEFIAIRLILEASGNNYLELHNMANLEKLIYDAEYCVKNAVTTSQYEQAIQLEQSIFREIHRKSIVDKHGRILIGQYLRSFLPEDNKFEIKGMGSTAIVRARTK